MASFAVLLALGLGFGSGLLVQKYYGVGRLLAALRITRSRSPAPPPATPDTLPIGIPAEFRGRLSLFILAGQSNMSGYSPLPASQEVHPRIFNFANDYRWKPALEPIDSPRRQVDRVSQDDVAGFSPATSFALALVNQRPEMIVGLIPCARGNTTIMDWQRSLSDTRLYGSCLKRARAASLEGQLAGVLVFQGEADAQDSAQYPQRVFSTTHYARDFTTFVRDLRADLSLPRVPVVFAQVGSPPDPEAFPNWKVIQEQQRSVRLPCVEMISTDDLPLRDGLHFTTDGYRLVGRRFAAAYVRLLSNPECR